MQNLNQKLQWEKVTAWTETKKGRSLVARPISAEQCLEILSFAKRRGMSICTRGAGYSFGDMILNEGQIILDTSLMNHIVDWNPETGLLLAEPGVRVAQVLQRVLGTSWTLPSCTGGMGVTMAGAVSNNVHGKDSWKVGNFGNHVLSVKLMLANGNVVTISRDDREKFRAIVSGMGLLGIILEVKLQLQKIPSPYVEVTSYSVRHLGESIETMEMARENSDFMIAWADSFSNKGNLGRGTVETARWVETAQRPTKAELHHSLTVPTWLFGLLPANMAWSVGRLFFHPFMMKCANSFKYHRDRIRDLKKSFKLFTDFNFMLNKIPGWKALYRPHGYLEFQPLVPRKHVHWALEELFKICQKMKAQSLLCAIKPHPQDDYYLSYEGDGYSVGVDIALNGRSPASVRNLAETLNSFVVDLGGKTFLAKDEMLSVHFFRKMYPQYTTYLEVKKKMDPDCLFVSDMARRLLYV